MTELSDGLVRLEGIDFRTAYEIGSALARGLVARGAGMSALPGAEIAAAFLAAVGRPPALDLLELERLASVENFIAVRNRIGGPRKVEKLNGWGRVVDGKVAASHLAHCLATDSPSVLLGHWRSFAEQARHLACREVRPVPVPMNSL